MSNYSNEITIDGNLFRAVASDGTCDGCAFNGGSDCHTAINTKGCIPVKREDKRYVIWAKVEQPTIPDVPAAKLSIYVIGSLRNPTIPEVAAKLRAQGYDVFDDWYSAGPEADDWWKRYEEGRGHDYYQALQGFAAEHVFGFDRGHLDRCDSAVLILPAGRSGHLELGYVAGKGKPTYILHDNPDRWDVMYRFATAVVPDVDSLIKELAK